MPPFVIRHSTFFRNSSFVIRHLLTLTIVLFTQSCGQPLLDLESAPDTAFFSATSMRIHPIFTQVKDWSGDGKPDGIEVLMEFQDQFGDPAKAAGTFENGWLAIIESVDEAAAKLLYLALRNIAKKWTRNAVPDWPAALNRFGIIYEGRLPVD